MMFNSFVKIDDDFVGIGANDYTGKIGRIVGKYPTDDSLYTIYFENGERKNFFTWQFSVVNLSDT